MVGTTGAAWQPCGCRPKGRLAWEPRAETRAVRGVSPSVGQPVGYLWEYAAICNRVCSASFSMTLRT